MTVQRDYVTPTFYEACHLHAKVVCNIYTVGPNALSMPLYTLATTPL